MVATHPVAVGQIDANSGRRIEVAGNDDTLYDLCADAAADGLAEADIDGTVVFEPLCMVGKYAGAAGSCLVAEIDDAFPTGLVAKRVTIGFDETIDEVHLALRIFEPCNGIFVEGNERTSPVEFDEETNDALLSGMFGIGQGIFKMTDNPADGSTVESVGTGDIFAERTVFGTF